MGGRPRTDSRPTRRSVAANIYAASASADHRAVEQLLTADPSLANRQGGPLGWDPLLYLTYARYAPEVPLADVLTTAGLLPSTGADPNAGFLWNGLPTPFTALTGVFGSGEQGVSNQPPHPHALMLGRLLLEAGADPNDGQALYNRMFEADDSHLELLFDYGLGSGDGGPVASGPARGHSQPGTAGPQPTQLGGQSRHGGPHPAAGRAWCRPERALRRGAISAAAGRRRQRWR